MVYPSLVLLAPLLIAIGGGSLPEAFHRTSQVMRGLSRRETPTLPRPYLNLPVFVDSRFPLVTKEYFSPATGTGQEPLPQPVRELLLPAPSNTSPPIVSGVSVNTSCKPKKMLVQVPKSILGTGDLSSQVKLGTCRANRATTDYLLFDYDLGLCGTKRAISNNQVMYSNTLKYDPPRPQGPIRRAAPFTLPVACYYNRYLYSYKIGYTPKMRMRKIFKPMKNRAKFILSPRNARWERLSPSDQYVLGEPMYFEAEAPSISQDKRLYVHSCYATPEKSHTSTPQFPVVENFGCMVESKNSRSRFIPYRADVVRFSVDAFMFNEISSQLFMHCRMSAGNTTPTPAAKSCNYDNKRKRWVELYGSDSVCTCCESTCSSASSTETMMIRSRPWTIKSKAKPTAAPKRKAMSTTTTITAAAKPQTITQTTVGNTSPQPKKSAGTASEVESTDMDSEWRFGGAGVAWIEEEDEEKHVKGSAVLEEEDEEEKVTAPRLIFEDIFGLDK